MGSSLCLKGVHAHWDLSVGEFVKGNSSVTLGGRGWKRTVSTEIAGFCMIFSQRFSYVNVYQGVYRVNLPAKSETCVSSSHVNFRC